MTTTGELRTIIEELELVDVGDAASYLGEESIAVEETPSSEIRTLVFAGHMKYQAKDDGPFSLK